MSDETTTVWTMPEGEHLPPTEGFFELLEHFLVEQDPECPRCSLTMRFLGFFTRMRDGRMERMPEFVCDYCGKTPTESGGTDFEEKLAA
jgi:transposase-like protein